VAWRTNSDALSNYAKSPPRPGNDSYRFLLHLHLQYIDFADAAIPIRRAISTGRYATNELQPKHFVHMAAWSFSLLASGLSLGKPKERT
jgi:hypothetical protein